MNSTVNPLIYLLRIQRYREWLKSTGTRVKGETRLSLIILNENFTPRRGSIWSVGGGEVLERRIEEEKRGV